MNLSNKNFGEIYTHSIYKIDYARRVFLTQLI